MKKRINLSIIAVLSVFIFSCKNSVELVKRHYNKGYYMAGHSSKHKQKNNSGIASIALAEEMKSIPAILNNDEKPAGELIASIKTESTATTKTTKAKSPAQHESLSSGITTHHTTNTPVITATKQSQPQSQSGASGDADAMLILLVILAIFIPPLAVYLKNESINKWFWVTLVLCLLTFSYFIFVFGGLLWLAAAIIAILYVLGKI